MYLAGVNSTAMATSQLLLSSVGIPTQNMAQAGAPSVSASSSLTGSVAPNSSILTKQSPSVQRPDEGAKLFKSALRLVPVALLGAVVCLLGACTFDPSGLGTSDGGTTGDGGPDDSGTPPVDAGSDSGDDSGTTDGGMEYPSDHIPTQSLPTDGQTLPPARAFMSWQDGVIPGGNSTWYRSCYTAVGLADIDDADECPNETIDTNRFRVIDPLTPSQSYFWKVQTCYDAIEADCTDYSPVRSFSTDNSLLGWWRFNEGSGSTASDSSSAGNNGTLTNFDTSTAWTPGLIGGALSFDGTDDFVELGNILNFDSTTPYTISAWTNRQSTGTDDTIISRTDYTDSTLQRGYWFGFIASGNLNFTLNSDNSTGDQIRVDSTTLFGAGTPHHVALSYDGSLSASGVKMYVDGVEDATTLTNDNLSGTTLNSAPTRLGGSVDTSGMPLASLYNFDGVLDDVAVYSRVLTLPEVINETCSREALAGSSPLPLICQ